MSPPPLNVEQRALTLRRVVGLRWLTCAVFVVAVLVAPGWLAVVLPSGRVLAILGLLAGFNLLAMWRLRRGARPQDLELFSQFSVDLVGLTGLLFLTGGAANPLISLYLPPLAVAATVLPGRFVAALTLASAVGYTLLHFHAMPLAIPDVQQAVNLHLAGMWLTFILSAILISTYVARMTASARARDAALAAARERALQDARVVALGGLAAGAAHELGTPLATMALLAGELEQDSSLSAGALRDVSLLRSQIELCKRILSGLAQRAGAARNEQSVAIGAVQWVARLLNRWQALRPTARWRLDAPEGTGQPSIAADSALDQALLNLLNNAADACAQPVEVAIRWSASTLAVEIRDHGPGFGDSVLAAAGREPVASTKGGAGIGLLLARTAIERSGGRLRLANAPDGGAIVGIEFPR